MIDPQPGDEGRGVIFRAHSHKAERGVVSSWNKACVFVRYGEGSTAAATFREALDWEFPRRAHFCTKYAPDVMAGGSDCANCGWPQEEHEPWASPDTLPRAPAAGIKGREDAGE